MKKTAQRLELAAEYAEKAAEDDNEMKALYLLNQREISSTAAASSSSAGALSPVHEKEQEGRAMRSHLEASMLTHRLTGGGKPAEQHGQSGPMATALNPNRHCMMIHGRPVVFLSVLRHKTCELSAMRRPFSNQ